MGRKNHSAGKQQQRKVSKNQPSMYGRTKPTRPRMVRTYSYDEESEF